MCPLDCPDTCSLSVTVVDGKISEIHGSSANPFTDGVICNKVARSYPEFVHGAGRLTQPLKRTGSRGEGRFEPVSWEQAIDLVYDGFSRAVIKHGPQSVLPFNYAGPHGELAGGSMARRFFHKLGATLLNRGPLCGIVRGTAYTSLYGPAPGMPPEQAKDADLVVVWGNNVTVSNLHLMRVLKDARKRGVQLVVIDPKRTKIAERADLFLQLTPGTDVILAMATAAELERRGALDDAFIAQWTVGFDRYMDQARTNSVADVVSHCGIPGRGISPLCRSLYRRENRCCIFWQRHRARPQRRLWPQGGHGAAGADRQSWPARRRRGRQTGCPDSKNDGDIAKTRSCSEWNRACSTLSTCRRSFWMRISIRRSWRR